MTKPSTFSFKLRVVHVLMPKHIVKADSDIGVQKVVKKVIEEDVQLNWTLISQDLDSYEEAQELLYEVVHLWVTIRGFLIASMWMETYKQATKQTKVNWTQETFTLKIFTYIIYSHVMYDSIMEEKY